MDAAVITPACRNARLLKRSEGQALRRAGTAQNQLTAEQIQGFVDPAVDLIPFVAGGNSKVDYIVQDGNLYLEIKVSKM